MKYGYWLSNIPGMTSAKITYLYSRFSSAEEMFHAPRSAYEGIHGLLESDIAAISNEERKNRIFEDWCKFQEKGIGFTYCEAANYPANLRGLLDAPFSLYYMGRLPEEGKKRVAIVGARGRSEYGRQVARQLALALGERDVDVISGLALGIDADAHKGALDGNGNTYAVLGCGVDICYPSSNRFLYDEILKTGGIISEYRPGTKPQSFMFPNRNRIISGLCDYVVIIEAKERSGSLITADYAMEQGKEVYAVPGRIFDPLSQGCNRLIRQGAGTLDSIDSFLEELDLSLAKDPIQLNFTKNLLEKDELLVYSLVDFCPCDLGKLMEKSNFSLSELLMILERLEQKGFVRETVPNYYVRTC